MDTEQIEQITQEILELSRQMVEGWERLEILADQIAKGEA
jgi:hypothetical protein